MALATTMDKVGPMCRYVEDAVIVFNAIYGPDKRDGSVADAAFRWNPDAPLSGYTIGYLRVPFEGRGGGPGVGAGAGAGVGPAGAPAGGAAGAAGAAAAGAAGARGGGAPGGGRGGLTPEQLQDVLNVYRKLGAKLEAVDSPDAAIAGATGLILSVESAASFDEITRSGDINQLQNLQGSRSNWPNTFRQARFVSAVEYIRAMRARTILMQQMDGFMSKYDAILSPGDSMATITNRTGHPAVSVKSGFANGLPQQLVVTGKLYDEATICRIALAYEQATEWRDKHPTLAWGLT